MKPHCVVCQKRFEPKSSWQKYCSKQCREKIWHYSKTKLEVSPSTVGTIAELIVSVDLLRKGWEVYRALSPAASCDILVLKNSKSYKFEIRTGRYFGPEKKVYYPSKNIKADNLAIVTFVDNKIHYFPPLEELV